MLRHHGCVLAVLLSFTSSASLAQESKLSFLAKPPSFDASGFVVTLDGGNGTFRESRNSKGVAMARAEVGYDFVWRQFLIAPSLEYLIGGIPKVASDPGVLKFNSISAAKLKLGWFYENWLLFGSVGWAHASLSFTDRVTTTRSSSDGMLYAIGLEYFVEKDLSVNVQISRYNLGDVTVNSLDGWKTMHPSLQIATMGFRYRF